MDDGVNGGPHSAKDRGKELLLRVVVCLLVCVALTGAVFVVVVSHKRSVANRGFSPAIIKQLSGFRLYSPKSNASTDFRLVPSSVSYQSSVLVFSMKDPSHKSLAFTEEALPPNFDTSSLQADKQFNTEYGQAWIYDGGDRTTGTLITGDKTWILVNAPQPIGADLMQRLLTSLSPTP